MMTARDFSKRFPWDAAFPGLLLACIGLGLMLLQVWKEGGRGVAAELLAESHAKVKHAVHRERGNKYSRELTELRNAGPNRQTAMAEIDALQKRASGGGGSALTVHSRAHKSRESDGLGRLAAAHGIESSKKMLAEIMSLRHYKSSNREIQELANGFESHSSLSHRFKSDVSKDVAGSRQRQALDQKQREAAALRLEAGRKTRDEMMKKVENEAVGTIALALERTFKPMQSMLYKDETELDALAARKQQLAEQDGIADRAARRINTEIKARIERKLDRVLKKKETVLEHSSPKYLNQVHKKAKAALHSVVNPDSISSKDSTSSQSEQTKQDEASDPWSAKVASFLADTMAYIQQQATDSTTGAGGAKAASDSLAKFYGSPSKAQVTVAALKPVRENQIKITHADLAIDATKSELERQLRSAEASAGIKDSTPAATTQSAVTVRMHRKAASVPQSSVSSAPKQSDSSNSAAEVVSGLLDSGADAVEGAGMSERKKRAFQRALNSYL